MDELQQRVTFRFGGATDIRYLREVPNVGDFASHGNELWVVSRVEVDPLGVLVICENSSGTGGRRRATYVEEGPPAGPGY